MSEEGHSEDAKSDDDKSGDTDDSPDVEELQAKIVVLTEERDKWKGLSRKHEGRARDNANAATEVKTINEQLAELRKQLAERDATDLVRSGRLAMERVKSGLASKNVKIEDLTDVLALVDPASTLLKDGEPDDAAIAKLVSSLAKVSGHVQPDPDQGKKGGSAPADMNALIRRARGVPT